MMNYSLTTTEVTVEEYELSTENGRSSATIAVISSALILIFLISLFGNLGIIYLFSKDKQLKQYEASRLVINLSFTDLFSALLIVLSSCISLIADEWRLGSVWCNFQCAFNYCFIIVSMFTLSFISLDRYYAVEHPLDYTIKVNGRKIRMWICFTWVQGSLFAAVPYIGGWIVYDYWEIVCAIDWNSSAYGPLIYVIVAFVFCFMLPGVLMVYCYSKVCHTVFFEQKSVAENNSTIKREYKVLVSFLIVCACFFLCMTPFCVTKLIKIVSSEFTIPGWLSTLATFLQYLSSATNPLIYGLLRKDVQKAMKRQLKKLIRYRKSRSAIRPGGLTQGGLGVDQQTTTITATNIQVSNCNQ